MSKNPSLPGADALFKSPTTSKIDNQESVQPVKVDYMKTGKLVNIITPKRKRSPKPHEEGLIRYTLYFTPELLDELEEVWMRLRRKRHQKIQKWKIINVILQKHLGDIEYIEKLLDLD